MNSDHEIEKLVIGSAIMHEKAAMDLLEGIKTPDVFTDEVCRNCYKAIKSLLTRSKPVDMMSVPNEVAALKLGQKNDYYLFVIDFTSRVVSSLNQENNCKLLVDFYVRRRMRVAGLEIQQMEGNDTVEATSLMMMAIQKIADIEKDLGQESTQSWDESVDEAYESIIRMSSGKLSGIPTGLLELDRVLGGYQNGHLTTIAGRPGMGKSALALTSAMTCAKRVGPVLIISREMTVTELIKRMIASTSQQFTMREMFSTGAKKEMQEQLRKECEAIKKLPFFVEEMKSHIDDIMFLIKKYVTQFGVVEVFVDHVGLLKGFSNKRYGSETAELTEITRELKQCAKVLDIPIIQLSQLNREVEKRGGMKRPILADLKQSGSVEEDSNSVIFLYNPSYYDITEWEDGSPSDGQVELIVPKNRNGETGFVRAKYVGNKTAFYDMEDKLFKPIESSLDIGDYNFKDDDTSDFPFDLK